MASTETGRLEIIRCDNCGTNNRVPATASGVPRCGKCHSPLPWITEAGDNDFEKIAEAATIPVLVDLWAEWCGPCKMVTPTLEELAHQMAGQLKLVKVNVDSSPALARRYDVRGIPPLLLLRKGQVVSRQTGAAPKPVLKQWLDSSLGDS